MSLQVAAADIELFSRDAEASLDDLDTEPRPDVLRLHTELWHLRGCYGGACGPGEQASQCRPRIRRI
jgi:hypothetical protein